MRLIYIYHSGFALEAEGVTVIIDYYKDSSEQVHNRGVVHDRLLQNPGKLYVLATHFHPDHFNREVLSWREQRPDIRYIFSKDILKQHRADAADAVYIKKGESYNDDTIQVDAFGSTDVGSSFLINLQGWSIFHAGDLNNWHWSEESTEEEMHKANGDFLVELTFIGGKLRGKMDLAMFPVDRRMGRDYQKGPKQFIDRFKPSIFVPMHFSEDYDGGNAFGSYVEAAGCRFIPIHHRGESFELTK
jgi:L-ascorbate metabolism protein UlaG (beta-lactamase superfamily)